MTDKVDDLSYMYMPSMFIFGLVSRTLIFALVSVYAVMWEVKAPVSSIVCVICTVAVAVGLYVRFFFLSHKKKYVALCIWAGVGFVALFVLATCFFWFANVPSYFLFH
jgi:hypothetical protein